MSPPYFFRIDEIQEAEDAPVTIDNRAEWVPSTDPEANVRTHGGVSGLWWFCDGARISSAPVQLPNRAKHYKTYSMYFLDGFGFWVLKDDATAPGEEETWQPLRFDHDRDDGYSSYLCNVATQPALLCRRVDQQWPRMLLPDIYHGTNVTPYSEYGALKGELCILLGLVGFAMQPARMPSVIPAMFTNGAWQTYQLDHGRQNQRGLIVYVYTCPSDYPPNRPSGWQGSTKTLLSQYENGSYYGGKYYH